MSMSPYQQELRCTSPLHLVTVVPFTYLMCCGYSLHCVLWYTSYIAHDSDLEWASCHAYCCVKIACTGHLELCLAFNEAGHENHLRHAPLRRFYKQALQLSYQDLKPVLQLWHALVSGPQAQGTLPALVLVLILQAPQECMDWWGCQLVP